MYLKRSDVQCLVRDRCVIIGNLIIQMEEFCKLVEHVFLGQVFGSDDPRFSVIERICEYTSGTNGMHQGAFTDVQ